MPDILNIIENNFSVVDYKPVYLFLESFFTIDLAVDAQ